MKLPPFKLSLSVILWGYGVYITNDYPPGGRVDKARAARVWGWHLEVVKP